MRVIVQHPASWCEEEGACAWLCSTLPHGVGRI